MPQTSFEYPSPLLGKILTDENTPTIFIQMRKTFISQEQCSKCSNGNSLETASTSSSNQNAEEVS